jgi:disulfide bond formation protein DsbB
VRGAWDWFTLAAMIPWAIRVTFFLLGALIMVTIFRKLFPGK